MQGYIPATLLGQKEEKTWDKIPGEKHMITTFDG